MRNGGHVTVELTIELNPIVIFQLAFEIICEIEAFFDFV